ncbi:MAG: TonB-dependent receptor [Acidobacteriia bacterium]|nr:TonB-dependent receptor [Terriglobia bacterium]
MAFRLNSSRILRLVLCAAVLLASFGAQRSFAQAVGATLTGTVTDPSGAAIANAQVSILNTATGVPRDVTSNTDGIYSAPNLVPGVYSITITAAGFSKTVQTGITLTVGATQTLNIALQVGQASQTVEVTAEAPTVNLTNAEIGALTTETTIKELPLNGRSWSTLANLQPGVYQLHTQPDINSRDRFTRGYGSQLSISGARPQQNNYRVDGISINDPANGGPGNVLGSNAGVDAISEFSVLTTNYSTEYGRASGGVINATTKSGTNDFHGSAYEFLRNSWLDAPNFYDPNGVTPPFRRNQFGASAGGPIIKNKTFVFGDYEGLRQSKGLSFSKIAPNVSPTGTTVGTVGGVPNTPYTVDPTVLTYLKAFFPDQTGTVNGRKVCAITPVAGTPNENFCSFGANQVSTENYYIIRADHVISEKDSISGTFFRDTSTTGTPDEYNNKVVDTAQNSTFATVSWTHSFTASFVNSARFGYHRDFQGGPAGAVALNSKATDTTFGAIPGFDAPQVFFGGNALFTGGVTSFNPQVNHFNTYQFYDDAFLVKGKHSLKFGFSMEKDQLNDIRSPRPGGIFTYGGMDAFLQNQGGKLTTDLPGLVAPVEPRAAIYGAYVQDDWKIRPNLTINLGVRYEPMQIPYDAQGKNATLLSIFDTTGTQLPVCGKAIPGQCNAQTYGLFHNNTLKDFSPRVGFAWDPQNNGKMSIRGGIGLYDQLPLIAFMGSSVNANTAPFLQSGSANFTPGAFAPAPANCATAPSPKPAFCQINVAKSNRVAFVDQNPKRAYVMQWNFTIQREIFPNLTVLVGYVGSHGVHGTTQVDDVNMVLPTVNSSGYLWQCENAAHPFPVGGANINDCPVIGVSVPASPTGVTPVVNAVPLPTLNQSFGRLPATFFRNSSVYHGMMAQVTKKMSHGFQVEGSFTWQKSIDTASGAVISDSVITAISTLNWFDPKLTRGVSDFNNSKVLSINYLWNVPTPKTWTGFADKALGGWQLGGIFSASSGQPFSAVMTGQNGDALGLNNTDPFSYPNRLASCGNNLTNPGNVNNYVKLQCFQIPAPVVVGGVHFIPLGNAGRNIMTGPGLESLDFSVVKNTKVPKISETFNVQFRLEVFNITNRVNFSPPVTNEFLFDASTLAPGQVAAPGPTGACTGANSGPSGCNGSAGALSGGDGTATDARQMQLSLKVIW